MYHSVTECIKRERSCSGRSADAVAPTKKKNVTLRIRRVIDMFGIDEGKNLVADKLYEFFMEPFDDDSAITADTLIDAGLDYINLGDIINVKALGFDIKYIKFSIMGSESSSIRSYLILNYFLPSPLSSRSYDSYTPTFVNFSGYYTEYIPANTNMGTYISLGYPCPSYNTTNVYYAQNGRWRILRIA